MVFNSTVFAIFFLLVYGLYLATMRRLRLQNLMLLVASNVFYGWWDYRFLALIWFSTLVDYACARLIDRRTPAAQDGPAGDGEFAFSDRQRRRLLILSISTNLLVLGFFKYYDFFVGSFVEAVGRLGLELQPRLLHVILPVGISFYTFQSLSYTIDVYRRQLRACPSLLDFSLYVAFFPQLVAGPIVRAVDFLPQVQRRRVLDLDQVYTGAWLILWGLFKKVVIADNLATVVGPAFRQPDAADGQMVLIALYAFAIQIYCDFSGYTDIARGCAKLMGFEFNLNFNLPYLARNPREFWQRWHISLSTWLRDYLYIPLGGNRAGQARTCLNLMTTMVLGGLWHGAAVTYVLWGAYQGTLLVVHRLTEPWLARAGRRLPAGSRSLRRAVCTIGFFHLTCLGWLLFRAASVHDVATMLANLCKPWAWWVLCGANSLHVTELSTLLAYAAPLLLVELAQYWRKDLEVVLRWPAPARGLAYLGLFYALVWYGSNEAQPFIYFQF